MMLSWGGASDQIKNTSSLAGDLSFLLLRLESPFDLCYWVRRPQLIEISAKCLMIWKDRWSRMNPSHHLGLLGWDRVYICCDVVDFLKSFRTDLVTRLVLVAIATRSEVTDFLRLLKLIWRSDSFMIAITAGSEVTDFLRLLKLIWRSDSSMIAITAGSEVADFWCGWRYHVASFGLVVPCWLGLLRWWHIACWSLNAHRFWSVSPDLSHRFTPAVGLCWSGVRLDREESDFIIINLLIVEYLLEELITSRLLILQASLFGSQWRLTRMIG
jgi:hypothetical protein